MGNLRGWELPILLAIILLLFGARRLPDLARGMGRSMRIFKAEVKDGASGTHADGAEQGARPQGSGTESDDDGERPGA